MQAKVHANARQRKQMHAKANTRKQKHAKTQANTRKRKQANRQPPRPGFRNISSLKRASRSIVKTGLFWLLFPLQKRSKFSHRF